MAYKVIQQHEVNPYQSLSVQDTGMLFDVRLDDVRNRSHYVMLSTEDQATAERFFDLVKDAYEELVY